MKVMVKVNLDIDMEYMKIAKRELRTFSIEDFLDEYLYENYCINFDQMETKEKEKLIEKVKNTIDN